MSVRAEYHAALVASLRGTPDRLTLTRAADELEYASRIAVAIDSPQITDFVDAMKNEAVHQRERWQADHDAGKSDADWFWLLGWLAGKAVQATDPEKRLHHIITSAAVLLNWHAARTGTDTRMRPGIADPGLG